MLAAAVKRKLLLFHYDGKDFVELKEVALSEAPLCAAWSGNYVCLGCRGSCVRLRSRPVQLGLPQNAPTCCYVPCGVLITCTGFSSAVPDRCSARFAR